MSEVGIDTATERVTFDDFTISMQEQLLQDIRERRLAALRIYESVQESKKLARDEKLRVKAEKLSAKIKKKLDVADAAIEAIETLFKEVKAIELEIGVQDT